ncbi:MAG: ABC-2 family transporter protein [Candidatus Woesearchaeota archaeon]|nr:ABC-2 family transporter protein [Nanoarchaeota archaeon]USN44109.1 MAG: ABC-2 family transporter protein [Candidatus Woesearchaeota archaeon]
MFLEQRKKSLKNYLLFFRIGLKNSLYYKSSLILEIFFTFFVLLFLFSFWETLAKEGVSFVTSSFIVYILLAFAINNTLYLEWSFIDIIKSEGGTAVKDLTYLLIRNISPFTYNVKSRAWSLLTFTIIFLFILLFNAITKLISFNYWHILPFIFFVLLTYFLISYLSLIVSYFAFWFDEAWAFGYAFFLIISFTSGGMLPLYIMPDWLQTTLSFLPFQYLAYIPVQVLLEEYTWKQYASLCAVGLFWLFVLGALNTFLYKQGLKKFESQGG